MKSFNIDDALEILERTPIVLETFLNGLSESWIYNNEGDKTWSPFDIIGHLIHGEKSDWVARTKMIMENDNTNVFPPFDRFAQFKDSKGKTLSQLLAEFRDLRNKNIRVLKGMRLTEGDYERTGLHPDFGKVTLRQLLSTWVVHDLSHIRQIARVMAKQYRTEIGPWEAYLPVVKE